MEISANSLKNMVPEAGIEPARPLEAGDFKTVDDPHTTSKLLNYKESSGTIQPNLGPNRGTVRGTDLLALIAQDPERIISHLANHTLGRGDCWLFQGARSAAGHGRISTKSYKAPAWLHRASFAFFYGMDPGELLIRHMCGNASCVNPDHLEPGTHAENMQDRRRHYWDRKWPEIQARIGAQFGFPSNVAPKPEPRELSPLEAAIAYAEERKKGWLRVITTAKRYARRHAKAAARVSP
jgi:hypothetical protein